LILPHAWNDVSGPVATVRRRTHGPEVGDYRLYDVDRGRMLADVHGDEATRTLKTGAPEWARHLQKKLN
jgi:hypothetical protein